MTHECENCRHCKIRDEGRLIGCEMDHWANVPRDFAPFQAVEDCRDFDDMREETAA